jgi:hypothetical protein
MSGLPGGTRGHAPEVRAPFLPGEAALLYP